MTLGSELLGIERPGLWQHPERGVAGEDGYATAQANRMTLAGWPQASRDLHPPYDHHNITTTWLGMLDPQEKVQLMAPPCTL